MLDDRDRYHPRSFEELASDPIPVTFINKPLPPENVSTLPVRRAHSLHAVLCDALTSSRGLLQRLESGVTVPKDHQHEIVRLLYVATRHQVKALTACLVLEGLE
jgi:hypothetical protein